MVSVVVVVVVVVVVEWMRYVGRLSIASNARCECAKGRCRNENEWAGVVSKKQDGERCAGWREGKGGKIFLA